MTDITAAGVAAPAPSALAGLVQLGTSDAAQPVPTSLIVAAERPAWLDELNSAVAQLQAQIPVSSKSPWKSNTIRGVVMLALSAIVPPLLSKYGVTSLDVQSVVDVIAQGLAWGGSLLAIYGRLTARTPIG